MKKNWSKSEKAKRLWPTEIKRKLKRLCLEIIICLDEEAKWMVKVMKEKKGSEFERWMICDDLDNDNEVRWGGEKDCERITYYRGDGGEKERNSIRGEIIGEVKGVQESEHIERKENAIGCGIIVRHALLAFPFQLHFKLFCGNNSLKSYNDYFVNETTQRFVVQELEKKKGKCNFFLLYF
jgi:hypothetical protein